MATTAASSLRLRLGDPETDRSGNAVTPFFDSTAIDDLLTNAGQDVDAAAAEGWRQLKAYYANTALNVDLDNSSMSREMLYKHAAEMTEYYEDRSGEPHDFVNVGMTSSYEAAQEGDDIVG